MAQLIYRVVLFSDWLFSLYICTLYVCPSAKQILIEFCRFYVRRLWICAYWKTGQQDMYWCTGSERKKCSAMWYCGECMTIGSSLFLNVIQFPSVDFVDQPFRWDTLEISHSDFYAYNFVFKPLSLVSFVASASRSPIDPSTRSRHCIDVCNTTRIWCTSSNTNF